MDYSVKSIQAQQIYKVQPVSFEEKANRRAFTQQQETMQGINPFTGKAYSPLYPSVENSSLGRSLDLIG